MNEDFLQKLKSENLDLLLIADGTQFTGTTNFNFSGFSLDALIGSGYKWLLGGYGNGYVFLSEQMKLSLYKNKHHFSTSPNNENDLKLFFEPGHMYSLNFGTLHQSINYLRTIDLGFIEKTNQELCDTARKVFHERGLLAYWSYHRNIQSTIINLLLKDEIINKLQGEGILCSRRGKGLRVSFHFYNTQENLEHLLQFLP